jgi:carbon-monoxide dehydrogenase large subunit
LFEQCVYDPATGQLLSGSFMDYAMPRAADMPFFATALSEVPSTTHPLGFRGRRRRDHPGTRHRRQRGCRRAR